MLTRMLMFVFVLCSVADAGIVRLEVDRNNNGVKTVAVLTGVCLARHDEGCYLVATAGHAFCVPHTEVRVSGYKATVLGVSVTQQEDIAILKVMVKAADWRVSPAGKDCVGGEQVSFSGYAISAPVGKLKSVSGRMANRDTIRIRCEHGHSGAPVVTGSNEVVGIVQGFDTKTFETIITPISRVVAMMERLGGCN